MSKTDSIKAKQGYRTAITNCSNCEYLTFEERPPKWMVDYNKRLEAGDDHGRLYHLDHHKRPTSFRCSIGDFAVKKTATCNHHILKESKKA